MSPMKSLRIGFSIAAVLAAVCVPIAASAVTSKSTTVVIIPGGPQKGIDVRWSYFPESQGLLDTQATTTFSYIKSLGANSTALSFNIYVHGSTSNSVTTGKDTPPPAIFQRVVQRAHNSGLFVLIRPLVEEVNPSQAWRGAIHPTNPRLWLTNYMNVLKPYLIAAQTAGANEFALAVELQTLEGSQLWASMVVPFFKTYFKGYLMMNPAWQSLGMQAQKTATYGLDSWRPINLPDSASVAQLTTAWGKLLGSDLMPVNTNQIYLAEIGIAAQAHAYTYPSKTNWGTPIIPAIQQKWFQAACNFYHLHHFLGIYFWSINFSKGPQTRTIGGQPSDFQGLGTAVIKSCFAS